GRAETARDRALAGDAVRSARRARSRRAVAPCARLCSRRVVPRRPPLRVGGLFRRRRRIRTARPFREVLSDVALVDHHAHGILRAPPASLDEFRGLFSESLDPRQWPHIATGVTYVRAMRAL